MNKGVVLAVILLVGYAGFETFAVSRVGYRMEPMYIFERFVAVDRAMRVCGEPPAEMRNRFDRNRASVRRRAEEELEDENPGEASATIDRLLAQRISDTEAGVDALIAERGCGDIEIFKLTKGYENRARLNLGRAPSGAGTG
jgi:hypothetical protein